MNILVISASLSASSRCRVLALAAMHEVERMRGVTGVFVDLREIEMQFCDGRPTEAYNADTQRLIASIAGADGVLIAFPVYNYAFNAAAKNVVELGGQGFVGKRVGLLSAAGGAHSYMAPQMLAQCLTLDFQTTVIPRYVYATGAHFEGSELIDPDLRDRIARLVHAVAEPVEPPVI